MDLKIKGITWVGNLYQKLEAICQEVDNLVRQDPVKYVENQVQTGCESMKKTCSDVVQELIPSSVHPVEHEAESVPLKQNDENRKCIKSLTGIEENLVDVDVKELPVDLDALDPMRNAWADGLSFIGLPPPVVEPMPELSVNSIEEEKFSLSLGKNGDVPGNENPDVGVTENFKEKPSPCQFWGLNSVPEKDLFEPSLPSVSVDEDHENAHVILSEISTVCSVHNEGLKSCEKLGSNCTDETECVSDYLNTSLSSELACSVEASACSEYGERFQCLQKMGTTSDPTNLLMSCSNSADKTDCVFDPSNPLPSSEQIFSVETCENKAHGEGLESLKKLGTSCRNSSDESDCESDPSNPLLSAKQIISIEICENKALVCSVHDDGFQSHGNLGTTCSDFADETDCASDPLNPLPFAKKVLSVETYENKVPASLVHDEVFQSSKKLGTICSDPENETDPVSNCLSTLLPSEHSCEDKVSNMKLVCFSNSLATEGYGLSKLSPANFPMKEQKICNLDEDAFCVPDMSSNVPSFNLVPIVPCLNASSEIGRIPPCGMESNSFDTFEINDTVTQSESTGNKRDQSWESAQLEAFISLELGQSDDAGDDISGMDTIELSDMVEPEDCAFFMDNKELYAVSRRLQKLRSYRKRIQDAFTSKKRRAKEYEQLAIWYGDAYGESSQNTQNLLPVSTSKQVHLKKLPTDDSCDSEWELL